MGRISKFRSVLVVLIICTLLALAVLGAQATLAGGDSRITDVDMMKKLANSPPGAFVFVDLESMRADAELEDTYDGLEVDIELWTQPLGMDFDEVDRMGIGGKVAAFEGLFDLDQLRRKLDANGFVRTEYRGVEVWETYAEGEAPAPTNDGILARLFGIEGIEYENPFTGPCFQSACDEKESTPDTDHDWGPVDCVALMSTRQMFSRGHETVLSGLRDWVRDSIGTIKYGDASIYDDREFADIVSMLPRGMVVKYQKQGFLGVDEYDGLQISGVSVDKTSEDTLGLTAVCKFATAELAANSAGNLQSDLENDAFGRWQNVDVVLDGECVLATFETGIARRALADVTPPSITGVAATGITMTTAIIAWSTDEPATGQVEYGETDAYEAIPAMDSGLTTSHAINLSGLLPDTLYYFRVASVDSNGNEAASTGSDFRTLGDLPPDSYTVVDDDGQAALQIHLGQMQLVPNTTMELSLTNPDGVQVGAHSVSSGATEALLHMADPYVTPMPGTYTLSFTDASGKQIVWSEFTFSEADASVSEVNLTWEYVAYAGRYTLYGISFKLENTGDLPMYIDRAQVTIGTLAFETRIGEIVLPGTEKTIYRTTYITGIAPGSAKFVLRLMDREDEVFYTYSSTVIPS